MRLFGNQWQLKYNGIYIYNNIHEKISYARHGRNLEQQIMRKKNYTDDIFNSIDWDGIESSS